MSPRASIKTLYLSAIRYAAAHNLPRLAALLMLPNLRTLKAAKASGARTLVVLTKEGVTADVMTALTGADEVKVVALPRIIVKAMASAFLPYFIDDNNYASSGAEFDDRKLRYRRFWAAVLEALSRFMRIDGMISGNFSYASERELASALTQRGLPFIALHKENLKTPGRVELFERIYRDRRGPFTGRKILVYNEVERDLQIRAGVAEPAQIEVVGMSRLDRLHEWRRANAGAKQRNRILFFVFSPATGMPRIARKTETPGQVDFEDEDDGDISLAKLTDETCRMLVRLAQDNPDIEIVIKSKGRRRDLDDTATLFGFSKEAQFPKNMRVIHGGDVLALIADTAVVCGFSSTALLEAIAAGKPVVTPWFAEAKTAEASPYLLDLSGITRATPTPDDLYRELVTLARDPLPVPSDLNSESLRSLRFWTGNEDGEAGFRTRNAILRELQIRR